VVLRTNEEEQWMAVLAQAVQHDFYHLPSYHRLAEERGEGRAHLFVHEEGGHTIALPLLLRPLTGLPGGAAGAGWSDATCVYGYAGPVASQVELPAAVVRNFQEALTAALAQQRVVTVFSRLHPLIPQRGFLAGLGECPRKGPTVSIDLTLPADEQRAQFRGSHRTRINKLRREGAVCTRGEAPQHLGEFVSIYHETMRRVNACDAYFFGEDYFTALVDGLGSKLQLFVVSVEGQVAAGALVTLCDGIVQYHLGGTRGEFLHLSPMGLIFDTVRQWAGEQGARFFHLGGGVGSEEDSLFFFKAGFSDSRHDFGTWRWVVVPEVYRELCEARQQADRQLGAEPVASDFFPVYRRPVSSPVADTEAATIALPHRP